jgi:hypothetical protein
LAKRSPLIWKLRIVKSKVTLCNQKTHASQHAKMHLIARRSGPAQSGRVQTQASKHKKTRTSITKRTLVITRPFPVRSVKSLRGPSANSFQQGLLSCYSLPQKNGQRLVLNASRNTRYLGVKARLGMARPPRCLGNDRPGYFAAPACIARTLFGVRLGHLMLEPWFDRQGLAPCARSLFSRSTRRAGALCNPLQNPLGPAWIRR